MKNLVLRTVTGILFVAVVVASILLYDTTIIPFCVLMVLVAVFGTFEFLKMTGIITSVLPTILTFATVVAMPFLPLVDWRLSVVILAIFVLFFPLLSFVALFQKNEGGFSLKVLSLCLVPLFWIALPLMLMVALLEDGEPSCVLALFIIIWLNDTLAYCAGSLFGRHKLCERISPKKTVEGFVIAFVLTVSASVAFGHIGYFVDALPLNTLQWIGFAVVVVLFGTLGDLTESMVKRACGVKDSGNILPGHGGVLDRFDSVLMAVPVAAFYLFLLVL